MNAPMVTVAVDAHLAAKSLGRHPDFQVLRRVAPMERGEVTGLSTVVARGVALDVETTGLVHGDDRIIEFAAQSFGIDDRGRIVETGRPMAWLEDPGVPLSPEIVRVTGLRDEDLKRRMIIDAEAETMITVADFVVAHNAKFDRGFVEERLPHAAGRAWACSLADVDWQSLELEGGKLRYLLYQCGWFYDAHRASNDVTALLHLLDHELADGRTVCAHMLDRARRPTFRLEAPAAPFGAREALRSRGWRWDGDRRVWHVTVDEDRRETEAEWATIHVYSALRSPDEFRVDWTARHLPA